ncbi:MAG: hypothetical protein K2M55_03000 [Muribaculaceae bacterium]|nr:hypothetical protein [Muribaculaceae bacterium]
MNLRFFVTMLISIAVLAVYADDDAQTELRLNPEIEQGASDCSDDVAVETFDYSRYPFLRLKHKHIALNGDKWDELGELYRSAIAGDTLFTVVYLGDSHVQADFGGSVLRRRLAHGSSAGRGIAIPFRLAGTNQPNDYSFRMADEYLSSKMMRMPWSFDMPFTGVGIRPLSGSHTLQLSSPEPASSLRFHTCGSCPEVLAVRCDGRPVEFSATIDADGAPLVTLPCKANDFEIELMGDESTVYGGVEFISDTHGVTTHSIGNNGATFASYTGVDNFGTGLHRLRPNLVIVALGTNEAFGRTTADDISAAVTDMVRTLQTNCPEAKILLVGPTECYRKVRRRKNRRRSTVSVINTRAAEMARAIRTTAESLGVPYLNQYAIAGGAAAMRSAGIMGRDGVHFTVAGYNLWGNILADAVIEKLQP